MAWTPTIQVVDATRPVENLLAYIEEYGADAIQWANGGTALPDFATLYSNASGRLGTQFPLLMVLNQQMETDLTGDALVAGLEITLEGAVTGSDTDELVYTSKAYAMAVESMLANISSDDLMAGSYKSTHAALFELRTVFDILHGFKTANSWLQIFQTKVIYKLTTSAF